MEETKKEETTKKFLELLVPNQTTVEELINSWVRIAPTKYKKLSPKEFLELKESDNGISNLDKIWNSYSSLDKEKFKEDYKNKVLSQINGGTDNLIYPLSDTPFLLQKPAREGQFMAQGDFKAYWSDNYEAIINDSSFVPENVEASDEESLVFTKSFSLNIRVWIYLKSVDKIIDISPYVVSCTTDKTKTSGMFFITLTPFMYKGELISFGDTIVNNFNTISNEKAQVKDYLEKEVQTNDLVFIRFERLKLEKESFSKADDLEIPTSKLANNNSNVNVWDMIGIVDRCTSTYTSNNNVKTFSLEGRDFSKLFTDDGSYFLPLKEIFNVFEHWWYPGSENEPWFQRNIISGKYDYLWFYGFKPIREMVWFVINFMSNMGLVDDKLFSSWKDKRTKSYDLDGVEPLTVRGIWQIVKVFVEDSLEERVLVDTSISNPNGTLMEYMNRICQEPFVEFYFDTYINTLDLIIRQPPFTESAIMDVFKSKKYITVKSEDVYSVDLTYDDRVYSWYQLRLQNISIGNSKTTSLAYVPIVYLNEYVELFGNKKLEVTSIYLSYQETEGINQTDKLLPMQAAALNDLMYLVNINSYLPFTRKGTIVLNGDRRIKIGTFIKFDFTNEFFYVTGVTQSISFETGSLQRQTVVRVERGMYTPILENNLNKVKNRQDNTESENTTFTPSYFKIVDTTILKQAISEVKAGKLSTLQSPTVDRNQFDYFLNRKMYGGK